MRHGIVLEDFRGAAKVMHSKFVVHTPVIQSVMLSDLVGSPVYFKCENLQITGSYKIRGVFNYLHNLKKRSTAVVAASAGNHAQSVAYAAKQIGIKAVIFMPSSVSLPKYNATKKYGAEIILDQGDIQTLILKARRYAKKHKFVFIPPFDHRDIVVGQGTIALELLEQVPDLRTVVVPTGGGGLVGGIASAVTLAQNPSGTIFTKSGLEQPAKSGIRVVGVQAKTSASFIESMVAGKPVKVNITSHFADGIAVPKPGKITFELARCFVDRFVEVGDHEIAGAILTLLEDSKIIVEPAAASAAAAVLSKKITNLKGSTVIVLSGGNIDPMTLSQIILRGLSLRSRRLTLRAQLKDVPGQLAEFSRVVAKAEANVVAVNHSRGNYTDDNGRISFGDVFMDIDLETRGHEHSQSIVRALRDSGFVVEVLGL